jgi:Polysaccharide deacetylase
MASATRKGKLTISIDLELAWGVWDWVTAEHLRRAEEDERPICAALIDLFDRHEIAATWAMVAALLDAPSAQGRPGAQACWYAPDIIERLLGARVRHEIGSHSGRHIYFDRATAAQAREDLEFARDIHRSHGLAFRSFVYPRHAFGHADIIAEVGLRAYSHADAGWFEAFRRLGERPGRAAHLVDKLLPIPPQPVVPQDEDGIIHIPKSMLLMGRNGPRRFISPTVTGAKLRAGLARARESGGTFHLFFHPSNFYYRRDEQLETLAAFLADAADEAGRGRIEIRTMGSYAPDAGDAAAAPTARAAEPALRAGA